MQRDVSLICLVLQCSEMYHCLSLIAVNVAVCNEVSLIGQPQFDVFRNARFNGEV